MGANLLQIVGKNLKHEIPNDNVKLASLTRIILQEVMSYVHVASKK